MYPTTEKLCMWSGIAAALLFFIGLVIAGFFPPPSPSLSGDQVVALYQSNANQIRIGMIVVLVSGVLAMPPVAVVAAYVRRIEGQRMPVMTYLSLLGGLTNVLFFIFPALFFLVAAYRPERSPELTLLLNDLCWIITVLAWPGLLTACIAIAVAIMRNVGQAVFPRWVAYFNIWAAVSFLPSSILPFVKSGPFAWNGLFPFWIAGTLFFAWYVVMLVAVLAAIKRDQYAAEHSAAWAR